MIAQKRSKTNSGLINFFEKIIRHHPLVYYIARNFIRYTNIFEEDANGVSYLNFDNKINIIDVGASDGIATKFFCKKLNVNKIFCFEPNNSYVEILKKSNIKIQTYGKTPLIVRVSTLKILQETSATEFSLCPKTQTNRKRK